MTIQHHELERGLVELGALLEHRELAFEIVLIGAGAMALAGLGVRPTADLDCVGVRSAGEERLGSMFPPELQRAIDEVGRSLGLPTSPTSSVAWLNDSAAKMASVFELPDGFYERLSAKKYGTLSVAIASRIDFIHLKLLATTTSGRGPVKQRSDLVDLRTLNPTRAEILQAARWVDDWDGREDFFELDLQPKLRELGFDVESLDDE